MKNKAIEEYKSEKEDILSKSNNILSKLSNKKISEKSKIRNRSAKTGSGGSNEDLRFFIENSFDREEEEILRDRDRNLEALKEKTISQNNKEAEKKRKKEMNSAKNILSAFAKGF